MDSHIPIAASRTSGILYRYSPIAVPPDHASISPPPILAPRAASAPRALLMIEPKPAPLAPSLATCPAVSVILSPPTTNFNSFGVNSFIRISLVIIEK